MRHLIFDAGPLINFSMNGLLFILEKLKENFKGDFLITKEVKKEIIDVPLEIKKYELEALRLKSLFDKKIIKHADINEKEVEELRMIRDKLMQIANTLFKTENKFIHLLDKGESAALALIKILERRGESAVLVVDERTTRMLCENPENLKQLMEKKFHTLLKVEKSNYDFFKDFKIIRSTEIAFIAYKRGFIDIKDERILDAMLYGLKLKGCSISESEIEEMKSIKKL